MLTVASVAYQSNKRELTFDVVIDVVYTHGNYPTLLFLTLKEVELSFFPAFFCLLLAFSPYVNNTHGHFIKTFVGFLAELTEATINNAKHRHDESLLDGFFSGKLLPALYLPFVPQRRKKAKPSANKLFLNFEILC